MNAIRGAALIETSIVMFFVLLLLFGITQLSIIAYTQTSADGAAFVAAHTQAVNASITSGTPGATGATVAATAFPNMPAVVVSSPNPGVVQAVAQGTTDGFLLMPGSPTGYTLSGGDVEPTFSGGAGNGSFAYGATGTTLLNYCNVTPKCASPGSRSIYLAQRLNSIGNGLNGTFKEWTCHLNAYQAAQKNFPSSIGNTGYGTGIAGTQFDYTVPTGHGTLNAEQTIYAGDTGNQNSGMNC